MNSIAEILAGEIARNGPVPFRRFMEVALYHPQLGYYRTARDPFGTGGDFYTAEQLQPVFGRLIRRVIDSYLGEEARVLVELGAGRGEMATAFEGYEYIAVDIDRGELPARFRGAVFANEFFDALPVDVFVKREDGWRLRRVAAHGDRFVWMDGEHASESQTRDLGDADEGTLIERNEEARRWMARIAAVLESGIVLIVDYGYTRRERLRFPQGTLMSYHRHTAMEDVLAKPGERDITSHVDFTALEQSAIASGFCVECAETLAQTLLRAGERDEFAHALTAGTDRERERNLLQLKTLLFSMGEMFRVLVLRKRREG